MLEWERIYQLLSDHKYQSEIKHRIYTTLTSEILQRIFLAIFMSFDIPYSCSIIDLGNEIIKFNLLTQDQRKGVGKIILLRRVINSGFFKNSQCKGSLYVLFVRWLITYFRKCYDHTFSPLLNEQLIPLSTRSSPGLYLVAYSLITTSPSSGHSFPGRLFSITLAAYNYA